MTILLVMTDGRRHCIERAVESAMDHLGWFDRVVIHDDSGDPDYRAWLREVFAPDDFEHVATGCRSGFGGAIRSAWAHLAESPDLHERFVFHLEDDFIFKRQVDLAAMAQVLDRHPYLMQLALRRQPWNDEERAAGGIVEQHPDDYIEHQDADDNHWLEHRRFFTTNPSLYRAKLCRQPWPRGPHSEGRFTHQLLASPKVRFGFWGARDSGEWCEHIGLERVGTGY